MLLATGPPAYSEICLALERLHLNANADVCHAIAGLALAVRGKLENGAATGPPGYSEICLAP